MERKICLLVAVLLMVAMVIAPGLMAQEEKKDKEKEDDSALRGKIAELTRTALVRVQFEFQKDKEEGKPDDYKMTRFISDKTTMDVSGILMNDSSVLIIDQGFERKFIKKITVVDADKNEYEAESKSFLLNYHGAFLRIKGDKKPKGGITFADAGELNPARKLYVAALFKADENWYVSTMPFRPMAIQPYESNSNLQPWTGMDEGGWYSHSGFCPLMFDEKAQPIGSSLEGRMELKGALYGWRGTDIVKSPSIAVGEFEKKIEETKKLYANYILEVKFTFRQPEKEKSGRGYSRGYSSYRNYDSDDEDGNDLDIVEKKVYGIAIDKTKILIPRELPKDLINRIENIEVTVNETKFKAKFLGVYEDFTGMLVELEDAQAIAKPLDIYKAEKPLLNRALITFSVKEKFSKRYEKVHYTRLNGIVRGYKNKLQYLIDDEKPVGTFFIGFDGVPIGVIMSEKRELADRMSGNGGGYSNYYSGGYGRGASGTKLYIFSEIKKYFDDPKPCFDKKLVPLSDREMKRIVWLGVEFQSLSKDLAEQLGCQKITREGELGLLLTYIHEDSPAAKAGLQNNDILLKIQEEGKDDPIELMYARDDYSDMYSHFSEIDDFSYFERSGMSPWPPANNYLNQILTQIGEDKKITLTFCRGDKEETREFILGKAPYDYESAEKYKDENTGLTVRELTYEVRYAWRLPKDFKGLIISKIEEGSKAAIGGVRSFELITKIDDQPMDSIEKFKKLMNLLAKDETKEKARFTLERMGKSRFADVELRKTGGEDEKPKPPPEEEPMDEEEPE
jgi:hypothetical protein